MALPAVVAGAAGALKGGTAALGRGATQIGKGIGQGRGLRGIGPSPAGEMPAEEGEEETPAEAANRKFKAIFSAEGIIMLFIGGLLDILCIVCVILILAFGMGLLFAKILYIVGLIITCTWSFFRSGTTSTVSTTKKTGQKLLGFLKRQWKKLAGKAIPAIGDALPLWTWTIYSELTA